ncbi:MAG: hypothetical protein EPN86_04625 [Nanoarchaeota archaeon]|nr:MAG: hypothetical protein EPN86_04625 [Nanoarchaeota archaeon]
MILLAGAACIVLLLGILFGVAGITIGLFISFSAGCIIIILEKFGFENDFAIAFGFPAAMVMHSSIAYLAGFILGLKGGLILSSLLLIILVLVALFLPTARLKNKE